MKIKIIALMAIVMFMLVGLGTFALAEPDDPVILNKAPEAPIIIKEISFWDKETYTYVFYSTDPDGDKVYYDIKWEKKVLESCGEPDDPPSTPWLGPFESGEKVTDCHSFFESGDYTITIRAKDEHGNIGSSTKITVKYTKAKVLKIESSSGKLYQYGAIVLTCNDFEGINDNYHIGGLSNLNITATSKQFIIATYPIWGTAIIEHEVEIHIKIEEFLGVIQTNKKGQKQIIGLCKNIAWEQI